MENEEVMIEESEIIEDDEDFDGSISFGKAAIVAAGATALLGGIFAAVKLIPKKFKKSDEPEVYEDEGARIEVTEDAVIIDIKDVDVEES